MALSNLTQRVLTALVGVPLVVGLLYLGGWPFALLIAVAGLGAQHELYGLFRAGGQQPYRVAGMAMGAGVLGAPLWPPLALAAGVVGLGLVAAEAFRPQEPQPLARLSATLFGVFYPAACFTSLVLLRQGRGPEVGDAEAFGLALLVLVLIWTTDTFAYFTGRAFGRHPLAPKVSPKKTWEGAVGGALGALAVAVALRVAFMPFLAWADVLVVALLCGVLSQVGDLAESRLKRSVGVKDSGTLLPGHGGLLDRFDALLLAAPLVYLYCRFVAGLLSAS